LQLVITDNSQLQYVFENLPLLESLDLCLQLYPRHNRLAGLGALRSLRSLRIKCHNISWLRLDELAPMPSLQTLSLLGRYFCHSLLDGGRFLRNLPQIFPNLVSLELTDQWSMPRSLTRCVTSLTSLKRLRLMLDRGQTESARTRLTKCTQNVTITLLCCTRRTFSSFAFTNRYHCLVPRTLYVLHT
jgi:hypothetical protein